ncbi:helix-turn-helix transcriptional regulator [Vagococcus fluvialis]|uniref:AraC family transcriptional regulator n=1 Tax=Vagococcus fluvialis TaxID=2738 RepID=UPI001A90B9AC|nr:AraC family transcriptional regulator [Vagococcus fluvialis]MBO0420379.1 helix-turn-helix transcriptional regulator [Vagococcus fluvialis]
MKSDKTYSLLGKQLKMEVTSISNTELQASSHLMIYFVLSGDLELFHNGQGVYLKKGDIYFINNHDLFSFIANGKNNVLVTTLELSETYSLTKPLSPIYMKEAYDKISHTLAAVFLEESLKQSGHEAIVEGYLYRLIGLFERYMPVREVDNSLSQMSVLNDKTREIVDYINHNYREELTLDFLAETFFMSKYYLAHSFKEQVGLTIGNYLREIRLIHSHILVEKTMRSMTDIASDMGFSNVRSFSEGFKQKYGVTPTTYRQELINNSVVENEEVRLDELDALKILNEYAGIDGLAQLNKAQVKEIEAEIYPNRVHKKLPDNNIFVRLEDISSPDKLDKIKELKVAKYVSVTHLFDYIQLNKNKDNWTFNSRYLLKILQAVENRGLIPYLQISFIDYERIVELTNEDELFYKALSQLAFDIKREFPFNNNWKVEFRCFYELEKSGKLCMPVKEIIPSFKGIGKSLVHLPLQPTLEEVDDKERSIFIIDDFARVKSYEYDSVLSLLTEPKYIDIISENKNINLQSDIVIRMAQLEDDPYYGEFTDLVYANQMLWLFLHGISKKTLSFEPMSLDGTPLFTYFPKEMSEKLSVISSNNIRKDMWYAYQFRGKLFENVVFNNEFCVITKQGDNYRLLAIYPEKEVIETLFKQEATSEQEASMGLKINFSDLEGDYQIIEQKITPQIKNSGLKSTKNLNGEILSYELERYYDEMGQPKITVSREEISEELDFYIKLPIFGICYAELNRIK